MLTTREKAWSGRYPHGSDTFPLLVSRHDRGWPACRGQTLHQRDLRNVSDPHTHVHTGVAPTVFN